jgi:hypothetical protein
VYLSDGNLLHLEGALAAERAPLVSAVFMSTTQLRLADEVGHEVSVTFCSRVLGCVSIGLTVSLQTGCYYIYSIPEIPSTTPTLLQLALEDGGGSAGSGMKRVKSGQRLSNIGGGTPSPVPAPLPFTPQLPLRSSPAPASLAGVVLGRVPSSSSLAQQQQQQPSDASPVLSPRSARAAPIAATLVASYVWPPLSSKSGFLSHVSDHADQYLAGASAAGDLCVWPCPAPAVAASGPEVSSPPGRVYAFALAWREPAAGSNASLVANGTHLI